MEEAKHLVHIVFEQCKIHLGHSRRTFIAINLHVVGQEAFHQAHADFFVGNIQHVEVADFVVVLDGEVATLIKQRYDGRHILCGPIEGFGHGLGRFEHGGHHVELPQHFDEEGWRAALKPVVVKLFLAKSK